MRVYYHFMAAVLQVQVIWAKQPLLEVSCVQFNNRLLSSHTIHKRGWFVGELLGNGANAGRNGKNTAFRPSRTGIIRLVLHCKRSKCGEKRDKQTMVTVSVVPIRCETGSVNLLYGKPYYIRLLCLTVSVPLANGLRITTIVFLWSPCCARESHSLEPNGTRICLQSCGLS